MKTIRTKFIRKHVKNCRAVKYYDDGEWVTPWAYLEEVVYADSIGRIRNDKLRGSYRWWVARCNIPDCPGKIMIKEDDILSVCKK
jgi:hypothetical protein